MKKVLSGLLVVALMLFGGFALTGCGSDSSDEEETSVSSTEKNQEDEDSEEETESSDHNLGEYDEDGDGEISNEEFHKATEDFMDEHGY